MYLRDTFHITKRACQIILLNAISQSPPILDNKKIYIE